MFKVYSTGIYGKNGNYVRLLFINYSSAFNTIVPTKLAVKLSDLGITSSLCDWIQDFLTARPQVVKVGQFTFNSITLNIGAPQGCVLSPLLYSLYQGCPNYGPTIVVVSRPASDFKDDMNLALYMEK